MSDLSDGYIHVEYSPVNNAADDMVQQTRAIEGTLSTLETELNELKQTWWGGDAEVYEQKQAAWDNAVVTMQQLLNSHASLLSDVSDNYRYTEQNLSQLWSEVSIGL
ncbi:WXG100 family type VII secretion target [Streptomyces sp. NPDC048277]|uniref:WXG100 family type VII secretion target n=1 Tax=Streptomyces sp. NPDC048277 TaxID=3155027 RepID=UPI0033E55AF4